MNDQATGGYDPESNPRSLRSVSVESQREYEQQLAQLTEQVNICNRLAGMFNSAGWRSLREDLELQLNHAMRQLTSDSLNTMEAVAFVRGQIRALEYLLAQEQFVVLRRQAAQEEINALRSAEATELGENIAH